MTPSDNGIRIREAAQADVGALVDFNLALAAESEGVALDRSRLESGVENALSDAARARYFVAEAPGDDGQIAPIGCTMITTELSDWRNGEFWWIQSVYVVPTQRGRGVFSRLFRHIEEQAKTSPGVVGLRLYVERENRGARAVYEHLGLSRTRYELLETDFVLDREW